MFEFCFDVVLMYFFTYIEATTAGTCITFSADITSCLFFLLIFIQAFLCTDGQITIFKCCMNFIFLKSRKIYIQFIAFISFLDIGFHYMTGSASVKFLLCIFHCSVIIIKWKISKKVIK